MICVQYLIIANSFSSCKGKFSLSRHCGTIFDFNFLFKSINSLRRNGFSCRTWCHYDCLGTANTSYFTIWFNVVEMNIVFTAFIFMFTNVNSDFIVSIILLASVIPDNIVLATILCPNRNFYSRNSITV